MSRPNWIRRRDWWNPYYRCHTWLAERRFRRCIERPCLEGNCLEWFDPKTGRIEGSVGPVGCPCDVEIR